jgi:hypothetical protein
VYAPPANTTTTFQKSAVALTLDDILMRRHHPILINTQIIRDQSLPYRPATFPQLKGVWPRVEPARAASFAERELF